MPNAIGSGGSIVIPDLPGKGVESNSAKDGGLNSSWVSERVPNGEGRALLSRSLDSIIPLEGNTPEPSLFKKAISCEPMDVDLEVPPPPEFPTSIVTAPREPVTIDELLANWMDLSKTESFEDQEYLLSYADKVREMIQILQGGGSSRSVMVVSPHDARPYDALFQLARYIAENQESLPSRVQGRKVVALNPDRVGDEGPWFATFKRFIKECQDCQDDVIVLIPDLDKMTERYPNGSEAGKILAKAMRNGLRVVASVTEDYRSSFYDRFQDGVTEVSLPNPGRELHLAEIRRKYPEEAASVVGASVPEDAIDEALKLAEAIKKEEYIRKGALVPLSCEIIDRAIGELLIRQALGELPSDQLPVVTPGLLREVMASGGSQIQAEEDSALSILRIEDLKDRLNARVIDQGIATKMVTEALELAQAGFGEEGRPIGSFLFCGPTGVGKTETAKAICAEAFKDLKVPMIRIDMSEYQEKHTVSRLFGPPPGYVGFESGGQLTEAIKKNPVSVILFDEVEKGHVDVLDTLLQVLDDARMTDGKGQTVDFSKAIIIMTSNVASEAIRQAYLEDWDQDEIMQMLMPALGKSRMEGGAGLKPEFLGRLSGIVAFQGATPDMVGKILTLKMKGVCRDMMNRYGVTLEWDEAREFVEKNGFNPQFGIRPLNKSIQLNVKLPVVRLLQRMAKEGRKLIKGQTITLKVEEDEVVASIKES